MRYHCIYSSLPAFRPSAKLVPPTMPSADFCAAVRPPCDDLSPESGTQRRPPEVRSTAFTARPPNLPPRSLMAVDFAITCSLVRPGRPRYPVLVHRAAALLQASVRSHLAMTSLRFANPSAIRLDRKPPPPSCRSCSAHKKKNRMPCVHKPHGSAFTMPRRQRRRSDGISVKETSGFLSQAHLFKKIRLPKAPRFAVYLLIY